MMKLIRCYTLILLSIVTHGLAAIANAETTVVEDFYIVEMTLFKNRSAANKKEEVWPKNIDVSLANENLAYLADVPITSNYPELNKANIDRQTTVTDEHKSSLLPLLDDSFKQHNIAVNKLKATYRYQVLSHQVWLQKIQDKGSAKNLLITAGKNTQGVREITGSITLYKKRFLHLSSKLMLTTFGENTFNEDSNYASNGTREEVEAITWPLPPIIKPWSHQQTTSLKNTNSNELTTADETWAINLPPIKRIVQLQQKRKMRSKEIHYLDHPLFGLLIEIRPYKIESVIETETP